MALIEINSSNFQHTLDTSDILIVDFWAEWCGPCRSFAPIFEAAAHAHPEINFAKVNTEQEIELASSFKVTSIPTLVVFKRQKQVLSQSGAISASQLEEFIKKVKTI